MLPFNEQKNHIDTFLPTFRKISKVNKVPCEFWAINVSGLLHGSRKDGYNRLSDLEAEDFNKIKAALLKCYKLTTETCRKESSEKPQNKTQKRTHSTSDKS